MGAERRHVVSDHLAQSDACMTGMQVYMGAGVAIGCMHCKCWRVAAIEVHSMMMCMAYSLQPTSLPHTTSIIAPYLEASIRVEGPLMGGEAHPAHNVHHRAKRGAAYELILQQRQQQCMHASQIAFSAGAAAGWGAQSHFPAHTKSVDLP